MRGHDVVRLLVAILISEVVLLGAFLLVTDEMRDADRDRTRQDVARVDADRQSDLKAQVAGCLRAQEDRKLLAGVNADLAAFASIAAAKRQREGAFRVARIERGVARRSRGRVDALDARLPPVLNCYTAFGAASVLAAPPLRGLLSPGAPAQSPPRRP